MGPEEQPAPAQPQPEPAPAPHEPAPAPHEPAPAPLLLREPADGIPPVTGTERGLDAAARAVAAGEGPVAIDAERASGYRYGQRAYLVQVRRDGAGTWLIDPMGVPDLGPLGEAIGAAEWILHAATQDLPCLAEVGLRPVQLFDTELAARLLGLGRVGLAAVVEHYLGLSLAKEHSAVDWSTRPLPEPWLRYAALDVEVLGELRNLMGVDLAAQGKDEWARQEFDALTRWAPVERVDPWRRLSGITKLSSRRDLAVARELWYERDAIAQERDISPGRIIPDAFLLEIDKAHPRTPADLPGGNRAVARYARRWLAAVARGNAVPEGELPPRALRTGGPPPVRAWADKDPAAAARLAATRAALQDFSVAHTVPIENICSPDPLRRVVWSPPPVPDVDSFAAALAAEGCRAWQCEIVAPLLVAAFADHPS
ncbi:putative ribonuclease D [Nostocoides japonicum T1-X7]|uniref:Putative ribonuclease D n=1 Tax=Nostocoides japonicum T1-X7 TaxID=1194083 RepID=A0A077LTP6_9MICO|nr:HRDC domain-containing protein [Tetrasphaera japonica]CCH77008.1 putative ribonuclease D [Tetrasphaera japonica T1-X7]